jgi:choline dehydrogenase-like flavoprotein
VGGGSVFPTGGYLNPTLTMLALAHKTADVIDIRLGPVRLSVVDR